VKRILAHPVHLGAITLFIALNGKRSVNIFFSIFLSNLYS